MSAIPTVGAMAVYWTRETSLQKRDRLMQRPHLRLMSLTVGFFRMVCNLFACPRRPTGIKDKEMVRCLQRTTFCAHVWRTSVTGVPAQIRGRGLRQQNKKINSDLRMYYSGYWSLRSAAAEYRLLVPVMLHSSSWCLGIKFVCSRLQCEFYSGDLGGAERTLGRHVGVGGRTGKGVESGGGVD